MHFQDTLCAEFTQEKNNSFSFKKVIKHSGFTMKVNDLDEALPVIGAFAYSVGNIIYRKTVGFQKTRDRISLSQLQKETGFCKNTILKSIKILIQYGFISKEVTNNQTTYEILILPYEKKGKIVSMSGSCGEPPPVHGMNTQKKLLQKKETAAKTTMEESPPPKSAFFAVASSPIQSTSQPKKKAAIEETTSKEIAKQTTVPRLSDVIVERTESQKATGQKGKVPAGPEPYNCLIHVPIETNLKRILTKAYSEPLVELALHHCYDPTKKPKNNPAGYLIWFCNQSPENRPKSNEEKEPFIEKHKQLALTLEKKLASPYIIANNKNLEISRGPNSQSLVFDYNHPNFPFQVRSELVKRGLMKSKL